MKDEPLSQVFCMWRTVTPMQALESLGLLRDRQFISCHAHNMFEVNARETTNIGEVHLQDVTKLSVKYKYHKS